jgi:hypothetical protein
MRNIMDEANIEEKVIEYLQKKYEDSEASISSFPENPEWDDSGALNYEFTHPFCEILVSAADDINFGEHDLCTQDGEIGLELTIFVRKRSGSEGGKEICRNLRIAMTSELFEAGRFIPTNQELLFYNKDNLYWCYGQQYKLETVFQLGEDS